jgi:hypothetical protein
VNVVVISLYIFEVFLVSDSTHACIYSICFFGRWDILISKSPHYWAVKNCLEL